MMKKASLNKNISEHTRRELEYHERRADFLIQRSQKDLIWYVPEGLIFFKRYLPLKKKWLMLDLGCGTAESIKRNVVSQMKRNGAYIGVDISKKLLTVAKKNVPDGIFINQTMEEVSFPKKTFDFICFLGALHHSEFPQKTLKRAMTSLKERGYIFLREPQEKAMKRGRGESPCEGGINPYELKKWLKKSGCKILEWHFLNTTPFHLARRFLIKLRLSKWEQKEFFWKIKVWSELFLEKFFIGSMNRLNGTDMFIVARKS